MAIYQDASVVRKGSGAAFENTYKPGTACPHSGIYRCQSCGHEVASNKRQPLPPQHEKPHTGAIIWKLVVYAEHKKD